MNPDQYRVSTDPRSGITNGPNRADDEKYILRLIAQVITVCLETQRIIAALPNLNLEAHPVRPPSHAVDALSPPARGPSQQPSLNVQAFSRTKAQASTARLQPGELQPRASASALPKGRSPQRRRACQSPPPHIPNSHNNLPVAHPPPSVV